MKPIAIFYHCLFFKGSADELLPNAYGIVKAHMDMIQSNGLLDAAKAVVVGVNGGGESLGLARLLLPSNAKVIFHGVESRSENHTIRQIEQWLPGHAGWNVVYFHSKGATHTPADAWKANWGGCMTRNVVGEWRRCVRDLDLHESVGCHWMTGAATPPGQSIWAGNFWWAQSDFLLTLPSILERDRIKVSGLGALESRYESEVWIGNGPRLPKIKDYHPNWNPSKMSTCIP